MRLVHRNEHADPDLEIEENEPGTFDPQAEYHSVVDEEGDPDDVDALIKQDTALTAAYAVSGARFLAEGMEALAAAVAQPYTLRTTAEVPIIIEALQQQLDAAADVSAGLSAWLRAAHERGETGDPASLVAKLTFLADQIHTVAAQLRVDDVPEDRSPGMEPTTIAEQVTAQLQQRGVAVDKTIISDSGIDWELPNNLVLSVNHQDWKLLTPTGRGNAYTDLVEVGLPFQSFAHPAQIADIVADFLASRD